LWNTSAFYFKNYKGSEPVKGMDISPLKHFVDFLCNGEKQKKHSHNSSGCEEKAFLLLT